MARLGGKPPYIHFQNMSCGSRRKRIKRDITKLVDICIYENDVVWWVGVGRWVGRWRAGPLEASQRGEDVFTLRKTS